MPTHNSDIAEMFDQTADILEIEGANPFRVRAYRNAARVVGTWPIDLSGLVKQGQELPKLPGIGNDLASKIKEIAQTGHSRVLDELKTQVPNELLELMRLPGLGPKRVKALQEHLHVESMQDLEKKIREGRLKGLPGFAAKMEENILKAIEQRTKAPKRMKLVVAEQIARSILDYLCQSKGVIQAQVAGSFRRKLETIGDLDLLISANARSNVMERFVHYEDVNAVISHGTTRSTIQLKSGIQIDLRVVPDNCFGAALHYFTGSKAHNIAIRTLGIKRGLKINEYGIFRGPKKVGGKTEAEVFRSVGLPYLEPEIRENRGEIEAARAGKLPKLVTLADIRGDLHSHTKETDGRLNLEEMAKAAERLGYEYLAITDHSRHLTVAHGLTPARLKAQIKKIDKFNEKSGKLKLLKSIEVDILEDGSLDLPNEVLALLDLTVCSVHSRFDLKAEKQTERIIRAMDNPYFQVLAHPTGRLIGTRQPYAVDVERVVQAAHDRSCFLELNAQPERMDLADNYCRLAKESGVRVVISSDAHSDNDLLNMKFGVAIARRGWLEPNDILNTRDLKSLKKLLRRK